MSHDLLVQNGLLLIWFFVEESVAKVRIILRFWETAHLPLPLANINTFVSLRAKFWLRGGVGAVFQKRIMVRSCSLLTADYRKIFSHFTFF